MVKVLSFEDAQKSASEFEKRHLLLGNGFSIACDSTIFTYGSLLENANLASIPEVSRVFDALKTNDFEEVIRALESTAKILPAYGTEYNEIARRTRDQAKVLKNILVNTIAGNHPATPNGVEDQKFWACRRFLSHFLGSDNKEGRVYTLNYDLLLYWTLMHEDNPDLGPLELAKNDGFGRENEGQLLWQGESSARSQRIHYLHGALHLFDDNGELRKNSWIGNTTPLLEQTQSAIDSGMFPLFIAEGASAKKLAKIKRSAYLYHSFKSFSQMMQNEKATLFIFGHSLADSDYHILQKIMKGKIPHLYISVHGMENAELEGKAKNLIRMRSPRYPLSVTYFNASSAKIWDW